MTNDHLHPVSRSLLLHQSLTQHPWQNRSHKTTLSMEAAWQMPWPPLVLSFDHRSIPTQASLRKRRLNTRSPVTMKGPKDTRPRGTFIRQIYNHLPLSEAIVLKIGGWLEFPSPQTNQMVSRTSLRVLRIQTRQNGQLLKIWLALMLTRLDRRRYRGRQVHQGHRCKMKI